MRITREAFAYLAVLWAWLRGLTDALPRPRMRVGEFATDSRAQSTEKIVATGAGIAGSGGLVVLIKDYLIGGTLYATALEAAGFVRTVGSIGTIIGTFFDNLAELIGAAIPAEIVLAGVRVSSNSLGPYGVAAFVVSIAATIAGVWLFVAWIRNVDWSPIGLFLGGRE
ncbi:hypothetical protein [Halobellus limi]|uniref:Uncharacterized protein n=1 Tax=Halobellus limi TaxID=699433 RepID=A0A1H5SQR3_9EURY|nr:hypothetical protein [Halobellus limi]QCC47530.1 hypothetical protein DV707_07565 [Halobellus limi]SEF52308.1 hypothetical protein SAMN04488133_0033 [Halobellus limi]